MPQNDNDKQTASGKSSRGVRFASQDTVHTLPSSNKRSLEDDEADPLMDRTMHSSLGQRSRKRSRRGDDDRQHQDLDDADMKDDDDDDSAASDMDDDAGDSSNPLPSERELLLAKERRRQRREAGGDDDEDALLEETRVDRTTSLAAEGIAFEPLT
jgi:hypothetical protein